MNKEDIKRLLSEVSHPELTQALSLHYGISMPDWWSNALARGLVVDDLATFVKVIEDASTIMRVHINLELSPGKKRGYAHFTGESAVPVLYIRISPEIVAVKSQRGHNEYDSVIAGLGYIDRSARARDGVRMFALHEVAHCVLFLRRDFDEGHGEVFCRTYREVIEKLAPDLIKYIDVPGATFINARQDIDAAIAASQRFPVNSPVIINYRGQHHGVVTAHNKKSLSIRCGNRSWKVPYEVADNYLQEDHNV